nr:MAG TPA: hypothetical protein [Caudoviricetes sp.]
MIVLPDIYIVNLYSFYSLLHPFSLFYITP